MKPRTPSIGERLDRLALTPLHVGVMLVCALGLFADIVEVSLSNVLSAVFLAPPYNVPKSELSLLLASVFAGGAIGAPVLGWLADRFGRRKILQAACFIIALSSWGAAASGSLTSMTLFRFISGMAIGGYPPLTAAYLSDILPPYRRGALMMGCAALAFLGAPAAILTLRSLSPMTFGIEAWRLTLAAGGIISTVTLLLLMALPESPRWLAAVSLVDAAEKACRRFERSQAMAGGRPAAHPSEGGVILLPKGGTQKGRPGWRMVFLVCVHVLGPWATIGFPLLSAAVMVAKGYAVGDSMLFAGLSMTGPAVGILGVALFVDRLDRRIALILCAAVMAVLGTAFALIDSIVPLILIGIAFNLASAVYSAVLSLYGAEMFPTTLRASTTATAWGFGRFASIFVPLLLLPLLNNQGPVVMFMVITGALLAALALIVAAGPPGPAQRALD